MGLKEINCRMDILEKFATGEIGTDEAMSKLDGLQQKYLITDEEYYWEQMQKISSLALRTLRLERLILKTETCEKPEAAASIILGDKSYQEIVVARPEEEVLAVISPSDIIEYKGYRVILK